MASALEIGGIRVPEDKRHPQVDDQRPSMRLWVRFDSQKIDGYRTAAGRPVDRSLYISGQLGNLDGEIAQHFLALGKRPHELPEAYALQCWSTLPGKDNPDWAWCDDTGRKLYR